MLGRRNLLGLILGGGAAAVTNPKVSMKEAASALGVPIGAPVSEVIEAATGTGPQDSIYDPFWGKMDLMRGKRRAKNIPVREMPAHIASKRSWSPVFKAHESAREEVMFLALEERLRLDMGFRDKVFGAIFGKEWRNEDRS